MQEKLERLGSQDQRGIKAHKTELQNKGMAIEELAALLVLAR